MLWLAIKDSFFLKRHMQLVVNGDSRFLGSCLVLHSVLREFEYILHGLLICKCIV